MTPRVTKSSVILPFLVVLALLFVTGCGGSPSSVVLPLAKDRPTFMFFYTDN